MRFDVLRRNPAKVERQGAERQHYNHSADLQDFNFPVLMNRIPTQQ